MINEFIRKDRTFRRFDENYFIDSSFLKNIINDLRFCHSARNQQALVFKIITDKFTNEKIFPLLKWAGYLTNWDGPQQGEHPTAYILIGIHTQRANLQDKWIFTDIGIALEALSLILAENQLGNCIIAAFDKHKLEKIIEVPNYIDIQLVIAIGKPIETVETIDIEQNDSIKYFRKGDIHVVPKRKLDDILF